jgi:hypothetical protein
MRSRNVKECEHFRSENALFLNAIAREMLRREQRFSDEL